MNFKVAKTIVIVRELGNNKSHRERQIINLITSKSNLFKEETKMANITISDLRPTGADLFSDSESYLTDLNDQEMMWLLGQGRYRGFSYQRFDGGLSIFYCKWS
ncbi:hypothetical protein [Arthrospira platensis]|uniref:hypothetical protein n=1 Tax=Limnospira TaxID=2596745 RepID=UPI0001C385C8|nr:hypothetical protein [Arthrospira platensis]MDT9183311.1 hypothetical protein [Limnospira sp. PMC 289.06]MDT9310775.1 hypothetical protein [Limnospira sp. Paracas R14]WAK74186.1 hypothetical protein AP9108_32700 [Arthrospira sp. PCC 9108]